MSPSYADTIDKLVEDNYFYWEFNMRMKCARKGLLPQIIKPEFDHGSDRSTVEWKTDDLKALGVIAGDVCLTYQVYIRGALTTTEAWNLLEQHFNTKTLQNRLLVTKKQHSFKMEPGTKFVVHVDKFKELVRQMESIGESLDETRQLVLLLGSLTEEYRMHATVLENTPNVTLAYATQALSGVEVSGESPSAQERAFATKRKTSAPSIASVASASTARSPSTRNLSAGRRRPTGDVDEWRRLKRQTSHSRTRVR
ncbi:hypothetical protein PC116_g17478 [Phytophthora cactorum]|nr:hypothetical protein Pcac1_g7314 [Phytophthora cactorum]KAG4234359.1 hypothetical protein PC116_g17478 [Phytophthora cactorum]